MARSNPYRPFTTNPEQMALRPALPGNAINGLGESTGLASRPGVGLNLAGKLARRRERQLDIPTPLGDTD